MIRVLIVDDHKVVRSGLSTFLMSYDDLEPIGEARNGTEALQLCTEHQPDVVLMDLVMPDMDGPTTTKHIRERHPETQVIALTSYPEEDKVEQALRAGAIGYLLKTVEPDALAEAIRAAKQGRTTLAPEAAQALIHIHTQPPRPGHDFTTREREIIRLMADGLTNSAIANHLSISPSTVKFHVSNILGKLGTNSRTEAVAIALQHRLIEK